MGEINRIRSEADVRLLFRYLGRCRHEMLAFAYLDRDWRVVGQRHSVSLDALSVRVPLRDVARDVIRLDARRVVMAHNHPSGDPKPSRSDLAATKRIGMALAALGVVLVEHVILTRGGRFYSLRGAGLL